MAPSSSIQFVDAALSCTSPFALSYRNPNQKWLIRDHLVSLLRDFPSFTPSTETYIHDDGTTVNLLNASGTLLVSQATPPIPLIIWLHQDYPYTPPTVFLLLTPINPIPHDHPFVDPSGATTSPYLQTWLYPRSNLSDLAHNLVCLFAHHHPFFSPLDSIFSSFTQPSLASKMEALDRLTAALHYDMVALQAKAGEEIEELSILQSELVERSDITTSMLLGLEHERTNLKQRVTDLTEETDMLMNWLRVHDPKFVISATGDEAEKAFEAADEESGQVLDCLAADRAIEDLVYALDKAIEDGVMTFEEYIKQVRKLAREQFFHRVKLVKLRSSDILQ
ncbi:hypothetical protein HHK36_012723 [Tetracentron sinense]|uniref:Uncharacterized protein n=1 Tax=Tetracentron sinense TaxID=13715 RepID=A0A835DIF5_TETSI|nr:hypothetical protein HHK36_012723 [Tetracentron sinense]